MKFKGWASARPFSFFSPATQILEDNEKMPRGEAEKKEKGEAKS